MITNWAFFVLTFCLDNIYYDGNSVFTFLTLLRLFSDNTCADREAEVWFKKRGRWGLELNSVILVCVHRTLDTWRVCGPQAVPRFRFLVGMPGVAWLMMRFGQGWSDFVQVPAYLLSRPPALLTCVSHDCPPERFKDFGYLKNAEVIVSVEWVGGWGVGGRRPSVFFLGNFRIVFHVHM